MKENKQILIKKKHPLAIRWFHWINFPILFLMIWSGMMIYWANGIYKIQVGDTLIFKFFPKGFYEFFGLSKQLAKGMAWHFAAMWLFTINGVLYFLYTIISGEWKFIFPTKKSFREAWEVVLYDLGIRKTSPPQEKYNAAQRIAYTMVMVMGFGSILTGWAIFRPVQLSWLTTILGGYEAARLEHFILTIGFVLFFFIHILQVIKAGWQNFQSIVTGFEVDDTIK
ncbi:MAG: cytochrome b/b6 domain-containing protein [Arcicella sp.]|nr:cytochrome b/b6 domain-containing protein [Arcicella sp.]